MAVSKAIKAINAGESGALITQASALKKKKKATEKQLVIYLNHL
jgi:hypothetical protein